MTNLHQHRAIIALLTIVAALYELCVWAQRRAIALYRAALIPYLRYADSRASPVMYAHIGADSTEVTATVNNYYAYDTTLSCYTLQKWLAACQYGEVDVITLWFARDGRVCVAVCDLTRDLELSSGADCSDMALDKLPCAVLNITSTARRDAGLKFGPANSALEHATD